MYNLFISSVSLLFLIKQSLIANDFPNNDCLDSVFSISSDEILEIVDLFSRNLILNFFESH